MGSQYDSQGREEGLKRFQNEMMKKLTPDEIIGGSGAAAVFLQEMFDAAKVAGASDIHIEPQITSDWIPYLIVRFHCSGVFKIWRQRPIELKDDDLSIKMSLAFNKAITDTLKEAANCDLSTISRTQDSGFSLRRTKTRYRLALAPSVHGESIVLRTISSDVWTFDVMNQKGYFDDMFGNFKKVNRQESGLILVTGPTGSGKSSTLQSFIMDTDLEAEKVISIEDPVEAIIPKVTQIPITHTCKWKDAIKFSLRGDPDVIFVGEIRDEESASLAIEAANTGHRVFSTLHTNSVYETVGRLKKLGISSYDLSQVLLLVTGQRLRKKLCENCKIKTMHGYTKGPGCKECGGTGFKGRVPLVEYIAFPDAELVAVGEKDIFESAQQATFQREAHRLIELGLIDCRELEIWDRQQHESSQREEARKGATTGELSTQQF